MKTTGIKKEVINWLEDSENEKSMLEDLQSHGCISGMVGGLIYYNDTVKFFKKHKKEIIELVSDFCNDTGEPFKDFLSNANNFPLDKNQLENESFVEGLNGLLKNNRDISDQIMNWFSWFGFEQTAYKYYSEKYEN